MRDETKELLKITQTYLATYDPLLAKDRKEIIKDYGLLESTYRKVQKKIEQTLALKHSASKQDKEDLIVLIGIQETIGYLLSFIEVEYKSKVALDILKRGQWYITEQNVKYLGLTPLQVDIVREALLKASLGIDYDLKEKGER